MSVLSGSSQGSSRATYSGTTSPASGSCFVTLPSEIQPRRSHAGLLINSLRRSEELT